MIRINLLPRDPRAAKKGGFALDKMKVIPVVCLAAVLTSCLAVMMIDSNKLAGLEKEVASARAESQKYKQTIALINEMVQKEKELKRRLELVKQLDRDRFRTVRVMDEVAQTIPRYMWLTSLKNVSPDRVSIDGYAFSNLVVSDLMARLGESKIFGNVELSTVKRKIVEGQSTVQFTVTSAVDMSNVGDS